MHPIYLTYYDNFGWSKKFKTYSVTKVKRLYLPREYKSEN